MPDLVTITIDGKKGRYAPETAAERLVAAYGVEAYDQEIVAKRRAFNLTWFEVDRLMEKQTDPAAVYKQVARIVGEERVPVDDLIPLIREFGDDDARAIIGTHDAPQWWDEVSPTADDDRCPGCGSPNIAEQTRDDESPYGCLDCGEQRIERPANRAGGDYGRTSV